MNGNNFPRTRIAKAVSTLCSASLVMLIGSAQLSAAPNYTINKVIVAEDQWQGENSTISPGPVFKPHETDASRMPNYWISSNERGAEEEDEEVPSRAGISIFASGNNAVLSTLEIEGVCLPVVGWTNKDGSNCAPPGAEDHPRHPHGIDIDKDKALAYQVIEHSGLKWNKDRTELKIARKTDDESGLLLVYDVRDPRNPEILEGYVLGHAAEEVAVNETNSKAYVGNHEPSPTDVPCFVSVIDRTAYTDGDPGTSPYIFIDLPGEEQCVQGIEADEDLNQVFGTTHVGEVMYAFNSEDDTIEYSVDISGPFEAFFGPLPEDFVIHMHDLTADGENHRAYQTIHSLGPIVEGDEETEEEAEGEISGRWVAEVDVDPDSGSFQQVTIIDLSNGQSADEVPSHDDNDESVPFEERFVHAHFVAVDPGRRALLVSGEHTGNLGVVGTESQVLEQVVGISRPIPGCEIPPEEPERGGGPPAPPEPPVPEPHVHGVNIQDNTGNAYVSDEGEDCFYESVTILKP